MRALRSWMATKQHHAVVLPLLADAPLGKQLVGEVVDLPAFQRLEDDYGELGARSFAAARPAGFPVATLGRAQNPGEIVYAALRLESLEEGIRRDGGPGGGR